jgi:antitoxin (DNA-binding transcriptional repressor) of toxin-antitoxin stability system
MKNIQVYTSTDIVRKGSSEFIASAEQDGAAMLTKRGIPIAVLLPLSFAGLKRTIDLIEDMYQQEIFNDDTIALTARSFANTMRSELDRIKLD